MSHRSPAGHGARGEGAEPGKASIFHQCIRAMGAQRPRGTAGGPAGRRESHVQALASSRTSRETEGGGALRAALGSRSTNTGCAPREHTLWAGETKPEFKGRRAHPGVGHGPAAAQGLPEVPPALRGRRARSMTALPGAGGHAPHALLGASKPREARPSHQGHHTPCQIPGLSTALWGPAQPTGSLWN